MAKVVIGSFKSHDLRGADGTWQASYLDNPATSPAVDLSFVLILPTGTRPAAGYPLVICAHGINGRNTLELGDDKSFCMEIAQVLASKGIASLGIDSSSHGERGNSFEFFKLESLPTIREHFRQTAFDLLQLSKVALALDVDKDGTPDVDPQQLGFFGNSLGGIMGASYVSYDPRVKYAVLNVPGGGLTNILSSPDIEQKVGLVLVAKTNINFQSPEYYSCFPLFRAAGQLFLEAGDPINLAQAFPATGKAALLQEGLDDQQVPNRATEDLARTMKVTAASGALSGSAPLRLLMRVDPHQYLPANRFPYNGHGIFWDIPPVRTQAQQFLFSRGTQFVLE